MTKLKIRDHNQKYSYFHILYSLISLMYLLNIFLFEIHFIFSPKKSCKLSTHSILESMPNVDKDSTRSGRNSIIMSIFQFQCYNEFYGLITWDTNVPLINLATLCAVHTCEVRCGAAEKYVYKNNNTKSAQSIQVAHSYHPIKSGCKSHLAAAGPLIWHFSCLHAARHDDATQACTLPRRARNWLKGRMWLRATRSNRKCVEHAAALMPLAINALCLAYYF